MTSAQTMEPLAAHCDLWKTDPSRDVIGRQTVASESWRGLQLVDCWRLAASIIHSSSLVAYHVRVESIHRRVVWSTAQPSRCSSYNEPSILRTIGSLHRGQAISTTCRHSASISRYDTRFMKSCRRLYTVGPTLYFDWWSNNGHWDTVLDVRSTT